MLKTNDKYLMLRNFVYCIYTYIYIHTHIHTHTHTHTHTLLMAAKWKVCTPTRCSGPSLQQWKQNVTEGDMVDISVSILICWVTCAELAGKVCVSTASQFSLCILLMLWAQTRVNLPRQRRAIFCQGYLVSVLTCWNLQTSDHGAN